MRGRWSASKVLTVAGVLLMLLGLLFVFAALHVQNDCLRQQGLIDGVDLPAVQAACSYGLPLGLGYLTLAAGAGVIVLGALAGTPRWRNRKQDANTTPAVPASRP